MKTSVRRDVSNAILGWLDRPQPGTEPIRRQNRSWLTGPEAVAVVRRDRAIERTLTRRSDRLALGAAR